MSSDRGSLLDALKSHRLIAIVRGTSGEAADRTADALADGGVRMIEVTLNTAGALGAIARWRGRFDGRVLIGAGTVLDVESARAAIGAGAQYLISPSLNEDVISLGCKHGVSVWPGVLSANEILRARAAGADAVKIFPANVVGPKYFSDLAAVFRPAAPSPGTPAFGSEPQARRGEGSGEGQGAGGTTKPSPTPLPEYRERVSEGAFPMIAVGGVGAENIRQFLDAGAVGVGMGGSLVDQSLIRAGKFDELRQRASEIVAIAAGGAGQ